MNIQTCQIGKKNQFLGIFTKSSPTLLSQCFQRVHEFILQDQSSKLLCKERVRFCLKNRIDKTKNRHVMYEQTSKNMYWGNVQRCGSVWNCPVCAKKITEKRRDELAFAHKKWLSLGNYCYLLTLTNSHSANHSLNFLKLGQRAALTRFFKGRSAESLMLRLGKRYHIKGYEVTYGKNGWHPHHHILIFSDKSLGITEFLDLENDLKKHWINCCRLSKLPLPTMTHGLDLRDGSEASKYVSKWGIEHEMTKGHIKKGKDGGLTPFDLLQLSIDDVSVYGFQASKLFQEFALSFKGARQLYWSPGSKKFFGLADKDDQEIVDETLENSIQVYDVPSLMFYLLKKYQKRHVFLECLKSDWENECFGSGTAEQLISDLIDLEESSFDSFDDEYFNKLLRSLS